jgi:PST family polysaccharide transporter
MVPWREWLEPHRLRLATFRKIVGYGVNVSLTSIASFAMSRWDNMIVSRYYGPGVMGAYNYAYNLADTPATAVGEQISDVIGVSFPHVDQARRPAALARSLTMVSLVMLPLACGLGAVSPTVVQAFFDDKWSRVGAMLAILSVLSATRPMTYLLHSYLYACGRPRAVLGLEWLGLAGVIGGLVTVGRAGVHWACVAVGAAFVLRTLAALWAIRRLDRVPMRGFLAPLARPLLSSALMVAAILLARPALGGLPPVVRLLVEVALGALVYLAGAALVFRDAAREFLGLIRSALSRS